MSEPISIRWNIDLETTDVDPDNRLTDEEKASAAAHEALRTLHDAYAGDAGGANVFNVTTNAQRYQVDLGLDTVEPRIIETSTACGTLTPPSYEQLQAALAKLTDHERSVLAQDLINTAALALNLVTDDTGVTTATKEMIDYVGNNWF